MEFRYFVSNSFFLPTRRVQVVLKPIMLHHQICDILEVLLKNNQSRLS